MLEHYEPKRKIARLEAELARLRAENEALRKDGWQLLPKTPTADMRIAFQQHCGPADTFYAAYTAMLDAARKEEK